MNKALFGSEAYATHHTPRHDNVIQIDAVVVSPLAQITPTSSQDKDKEFGTNASISRTKKMWRFDTNTKETRLIPIFSANGIRGVLRRYATFIMNSRLKERHQDYSLSNESLHTYNTGAGKGVKFLDSLNYKESEKFRALNPIVSLFGAGLSGIEGKLAISNLTPSELPTKGSYLDKIFCVRFDETSRKTINTPFINMESVLQWKEEQARLAQERRAARAAKADNVQSEQERLDAMQQQTYMLEYIIPGVELNMSIRAKKGMALSDLELGVLYAALCELSKSQIGSHTRLGFGVLNWNIGTADESLIVAKANDKYILDKSNCHLSVAAEQCIKIFHDFIDSLDPNMVEIEKQVEQVKILK